MNQLIKVAVDAMGGDNAPDEIVKGAIAAVNKENSLFVYLVGKESSITDVLSSLDYPKDRVEIIATEEVIDMSEHPVEAIRKKKDSSMVVAMKMVKSKEADAFLSAGNSGAVLVGGISVIGRIRGIERTPFGAVVPTLNGSTLIVDSGANVDVRSSHLVQFAKLGSVYMKYIEKIDNPRVSILNNGAEEEKGNALVKETLPLLKEETSINFIGPVEARDIPLGVTDVVVCDGFAGNVFLKTYEGATSALMKVVKGSLKSSFKMMLGGLLIKKGLKKTMAGFDAAEHGGAPLLGCNSPVIKCHGSAKSKEICNACIQCVAYSNNNVTEVIKAKVLEVERSN